jgi:uncharacterized SAM-binding protein YcdF (DUF218 family)
LRIAIYETGRQVGLHESQTRRRWTIYTGRAARLLVAVLVVAILSLGAAFISFTSEISRLSSAHDGESADGIVVLTGGKFRIDKAYELLREGKGKRLLITGVYPQTSRIALRATIAANDGLFNCCVDIDRVARDTVGNARQTELWLREFGFRSLIVVTSDYHMPRSLVEFRRTMPDITIRPILVGANDIASPFHLSDSATLKMVVPEFFKYIAARLDFGFRESGNRMAIAGTLNF